MTICSTATVVPDLDPPVAVQAIFLAYDRSEAPSISALTEIVQEWGLDSVDVIQAGVITLAGLLVSHDPDRLLKWSKYPVDLVHRTVERLIWNGVWTTTAMRVDWAEKESGDISCLLDTMVGAGILRRFTDTSSLIGTHHYCFSKTNCGPTFRNDKRATVWTVAKALINSGFDQVQAVTIAHRAWADADLNYRYIKRTATGPVLSAGPIYYLRRVVNVPTIPQHIIDYWRGIYDVWTEYVLTTKYLTEAAK